MSLFSGGKIHSLFFTTANTYNKYVNAKAMEKIKKENPKAYSYIIEDQTHLWASYKFDIDLKVTDNTTNFMNSFNGKIEKYRHEPIFTLLEAVIEKFMSAIAKRAEICQEWSGKVVPKVKALLTKLEVDSRCCRVTLARIGEFSVQDGHSKFKVDLNFRPV